MTVYFGEAPVSAAACVEAEKQVTGFCDQFHAADEAYFKDIWYWNTPTDHVPRRPRRHLQGLRRLDQGLDRGGRLLSRSFTADAPAASVMSTTRPPPSRPGVPARRVAAAFYRRPRWPCSRSWPPRSAGWSSPISGRSSLFLITSFWSVDSFSGNIVREPTLDNYKEILTGEVYRDGRAPDGRRWPAS